MPLLACNTERTDSFLHAHGGVCGVVCVNVHAYLSVTCARCVVVCYMCIVWGCVYMGISVCHCVSTFKMVDTSLQVYVHVYLITQVPKRNTHAVLEIVRYISSYMLQSDVIV